jgi:hypothetical protein
MENRRVGGSSIGAQGACRPSRGTYERESPKADSGVFDLDFVFARVFGAISRKKFCTRKIASARARAGAMQREKSSQRRRHHAAARTSDVTKALEACGFLHCAKKREVTCKISRATRTGAMHCAVLVRATRRARAAVAHFSLTGFGVFR